MEKKWLAALVMAAAAFETCAAASVWEVYPGFQGPGHAGMVLGDFDGDGRREVAVTGYTVPSFSFQGTQLLAIFGAGGGGMPLAVRTITAAPALTGGLLLAPPVAGKDRIAAISNISSAGQILVFGGIPLQVERVIQTPLLVRLSAIADLDGDGQLEILALASLGGWNDQFPVVLDYETGNVEWTGTSSGNDVAASQLDGDPALELIVAGTPGRIIDGASHLVEWTYPSGFGSRIAAGKFLADGVTPGFATANYTSVQIFRSQPYSPVSEFTTGEISAFKTVKLTPAGPDQIAIGNGQWGDIGIFDPRTGLNVVRVTNPEHGVSALEVGDIDQDGSAEVIYGAGLTSTGTDILRAVDLTTLVEKFRQNDEIGPHSAVAVGNIDATSAQEVAFLTYSSNSGYAGSNLYVVDHSSGVRLRSRDNVVNGWTIQQPHIMLAHIQGDAAKEIFVAGGQSFEGSVALLDGTTLQDIWRTGGNNSALPNLSVASMALLDSNADGTPDVILATDQGKVVVLNGSNGEPLWQSVTLNGDSRPVVSAFRDAAARPMVAISRGRGIYLFDLTNHLLAATVKSASSIIAMSLWGEGASCQLGALESSGSLTLYRCADLAVAGNRSLPATTNFFQPIDAMATRFLVAAGSQLQEVTANGTAIPLTPTLGARLGSGNKAVVQQNGTGFDIMIGSDYMVTRQRIGLDALFSHGFDTTP